MEHDINSLINLILVGLKRCKGLNFPFGFHQSLANFENFSTIENSSRHILNDDFFKKEFPLGIDWYTIDGDHSYGGCLFDLRAIVNHINKNGIIIIDDYESGPPNGCSIPGVTRACDDFYKENQYLEKTKWHCKGKGFCIFKKP